MTLGDISDRELSKNPKSRTEESAAVTGGGNPPDLLKKANPDNSDIYNFNDVVDKACEGLLDKQIKHSIQRIQEMEERLSGIERETDDFLRNRNL